jgi:hypothetical protein
VLKVLREPAYRERARAIQAELSGVLAQGAL